MNGFVLDTQAAAGEGYILVVDDEPGNLKLMERMLRGQGYERLLLLQDAREVVTHYRMHRIDLIVLDIGMPHLDGFEVLRLLRELGDPLLPPVMVLTAQSSRDVSIRALNAGARDFVAKPFDRLELLARVRNLLDVQQAHRMLHDQRAALDSMVRVRTDELRRTRLQVVQRLGRAAEYRDNETGNHVLRMSHTSALLAEAAGLDADACELILHASPMHDIGKIGIPDQILLKPGKLTAAEWATMQQHTSIGASILDGDDSELLRLARDIALTHHEKWDGSGYPDGLSGEHIPLCGRIVAVADVFDALMSSRPYKPAWPLEQTLAFIRDNAGRHFDPMLVNCLFERLDDVLSVREHFGGE